MTTENLYPNGDGALNQWSRSAGSDNYALVDEAVADEDVTYVLLANGPVSGSDYYTFTNITELFLSISSLTFNIRCKLEGIGDVDDNERILVKYYDVSTTTAHNIGYTTGWILDAGYSTKTIVATTNPRDSLPWTIADINADQFVIYASIEADHDFRCTQFYVTVTGLLYTSVYKVASETLGISDSELEDGSIIETKGDGTVWTKIPYPFLKRVTWTEEEGNATTWTEETGNATTWTEV